jgi:hypothetical protein
MTKKQNPPKNTYASLQIANHADERGITGSGIAIGTFFHANANARVGFFAVFFEKKVCRFKKWRNRPGCDVHFRSHCLNVLGASCMR